MKGDRSWDQDFKVFRSWIRLDFLGLGLSFFVSCSLFGGDCVGASSPFGINWVVKEEAGMELEVSLGESRLLCGVWRDVSLCFSSGGLWSTGIC